MRHCLHDLQSKSGGFPITQIGPGTEFKPLEVYPPVDHENFTQGLFYNSPPFPFKVCSFEMEMIHY